LTTEDWLRFNPEREDIGKSWVPFPDEKLWNSSDEELKDTCKAKGETGVKSILLFEKRLDYEHFWILHGPHNE